MARDAGLEELIRDELRSVSGVTEKAMFGGWAFLLHGNLLCGARVGSLLVRLGKARDAWALKLPGVERMVMRGRPLEGWVRASARVYGNDEQRRKLIGQAVEYGRTLPTKAIGAGRARADAGPAATRRKRVTSPASTGASDVDAYLAKLAPPMRKALSTVRAIVRTAAPDAVESISYGIPTVKLRGKPLIYFGAAKHHCALYGVPDLPDLATHDTSGKGTVRFAPEAPLPAALVRKLLKARMERLGTARAARPGRVAKR